MQELIRRIQTDCYLLYERMADIYARAGATIIITKGEPLDKIIMESKPTSEQEMINNHLKEQIDRIIKLHVNHYFGLPRCPY